MGRQLAFLAVVETPHIEKLYGSGGGAQAHGTHTGANIMLLHNFDAFRAGDWSLVLCVVLVCGLSAAVAVPGPLFVSAATVVTAAIVVRCVTVAITGGVLWGQARTAFWTRHFERQGASAMASPLSPTDAARAGFDEWRRVQNMLQLLPTVLFLVAALREYGALAHPPHLRRAF